VATLLLGTSIDTPGASTIARVAGVAQFALVIACWRARNDGGTRAALGVVGAMVVYNAGVLAVLVHAGVDLGLSGIGLWPAVLGHAVMAAWYAHAMSHPATSSPS